MDGFQRGLGFDEVRLVSDPMVPDDVVDPHAGWDVGQAEAVELEPLTEELDIVQASLGILNHLFKKRGYPGFALERSRFHVLSIADTVRIGGGEKVRGFCRCGHMHIARVDDPLERAYIITHELAHHAAFTRARVIVRRNGPRSAGWSLKLLRSGLRIHGGKEHTLFSTFDEAATENVAMVLRHYLATKFSVLPADCAAQLPFLMDAPSKLLLALLPLIGEPPVASDMLWNDYFTGTFALLPDLDRAFPGMLFRARSLEVEGIPSFVDAFGLSEIYDSI